MLRTRRSPRRQINRLEAGDVGWSSSKVEQHSEKNGVHVKDAHKVRGKDFFNQDGEQMKQ